MVDGWSANRKYYGYFLFARDTSKWLRHKAESALKAIRNGSSSFQSVRSNCHPFEGKQD